MLNRAIFCFAIISLLHSAYALSADTSSLSSQNEKIFAQKTQETQPLGVYVGQLQEQWQFPSDHLPIGITFDNLHIDSWNVLSSEHMEWVIEKNSQGLSHSMIAKEHVYAGSSKVTLRDRHIIQLILQTLAHPTHPKSLFSLQECSEPFLSELTDALPVHFTLVSHGENALLIDKNRFEIMEERSVDGVFSNQPERTFQEVLLWKKDSRERVRCINAHLPGDPSQPARFEFAQYLARIFDPHLTTIAMGDMNFNELEMSDAIALAFANSSQTFTLYVPYCTNISPSSFYSKAIDHFLVYCARKSAKIQVSNPQQTMLGLTPIVHLLSRERSGISSQKGYHE